MSRGTSTGNKVTSTAILLLPPSIGGGPIAVLSCISSSTGRLGPPEYSKQDPWALFGGQGHGFGNFRGSGISSRLRFTGWDPGLT